MGGILKALLNAVPMKITIELNADSLEGATEELVRFLGARGIHVDRQTASQGIMAVVRKIQATAG